MAKGRTASRWGRMRRERVWTVSRREYKGLRGKSTMAWIRAIVAFNDSFRDRTGISYNPGLFDCLHGRLEKRLFSHPWRDYSDGLSSFIECAVRLRGDKCDGTWSRCFTIYCLLLTRDERRAFPSLMRNMLILVYRGIYGFIGMCDVESVKSRMMSNESNNNLVIKLIYKHFTFLLSKI